MTKYQEEIDRAWAEHLRRDEEPLRPTRGSFMRKAFKADTRHRLAEAQNWRCCYCYVGMDMEQGRPTSATIEHVIPISHGGSNDLDNIAVACFSCNSQKGTETAKMREAFP